MKQKILIVDDEADICEILQFNLEKHGFEVQTAEEPIVLKEEERIPDLILLDVMMTPMSGFEWAARLRANPITKNIPIIFCTARTTEEDLLTGFGLGSDDYITKPFKISEVIARVKAVLNRYQHNNTESRVTIEHSSQRSIVQYEGIRLDLESKECSVDGEMVQLTKLEFELLSLLLSKPGHLFSREEILSTTWPNDTIVLGRTVDVNITRIRKKIGQYGKYIRTKFGYGYMFSYHL